MQWTSAYSRISNMSHSMSHIKRRHDSSRARE